MVLAYLSQEPAGRPVHGAELVQAAAAAAACASAWPTRASTRPAIAPSWCCSWPSATTTTRSSSRTWSWGSSDPAIIVAPRRGARRDPRAGAPRDAARQHVVLRDRSVELVALLADGRPRLRLRVRERRPPGRPALPAPAGRLDLGEQRYANVYRSVAVQLASQQFATASSRYSPAASSSTRSPSRATPPIPGWRRVRGLAARAPGRTAASYAATYQPLITPPMPTTRPGAGGGETGVRAARMSVLTGGRHRSWFGRRAHLPHPRADPVRRRRPSPFTVACAVAAAAAGRLRAAAGVQHDRRRRRRLPRSGAAPERRAQFPVAHGVVGAYRHRPRLRRRRTARLPAGTARLPRQGPGGGPHRLAHRVPHTAAGIALLTVYGRDGVLGRLLAPLGLTFTDTVAGIVLAMLFVSLPYLVVFVDVPEMDSPWVSTGHRGYVSIQALPDQSRGRESNTHELGLGCNLTFAQKWTWPIRTACCGRGCMHRTHLLQSARISSFSLSQPLFARASKPIAGSQNAARRWYSDNSGASGRKRCGGRLRPARAMSLLCNHRLLRCRKANLSRWRRPRDDEPPQANAGSSSCGDRHMQSGGQTSGVRKWRIHVACTVCRHDPGSRG